MSTVSARTAPQLRQNGRLRSALSFTTFVTCPYSRVDFLQKELPYPLLSDPKRILIAALGAGEGGKTKRSHFIFEKGGNLIDKKVPVKPAER